ncbi:serine/threonine protein kinase [Myxococcota bacterium]|nr:serine/threonine protein kinase [Myxococcota bacterium]
MQPTTPDPNAVDLNDTLYDPGPHGLEGFNAAVTQPSPSGPRTTILPKIKLKGRAPNLAHEHRARYEILGQIGRGGEGEVLKAIDHDIGRIVALKRMRGPQKMASVVRFVEEIRTTGRLEHPNIVPVHDVGVDEEGNYYFIMKFIDGETLEAIIAKLAAGDVTYHARFGFEHRMTIFRALCEAIAYAHARGYLHRDIKPANVMIGAFGEVILMDWGIAKRVEAQEDEPASILDEVIEADIEDARVFETQTGVVVGTPAYMAPEQALGQPLDARADVYALCVLLHEFMTLKHYLADAKTLMKTLMGVTTRPVPMASYQPLPPAQGRVPADISWLIQGGVEKEPQGRYRDVEALLTRLDERAEGVIPAQCPATLMVRWIGRGRRFVDRHPMMSLALLTLTGLSLLGNLALFGLILL